MHCQGNFYSCIVIRQALKLIMKIKYIHPHKQAFVYIDYVILLYINNILHEVGTYRKLAFISISLTFFLFYFFCFKRFHFIRVIF